LTATNVNTPNEDCWPSGVGNAKERYAVGFSTHTDEKTDSPGGNQPSLSL